MTPTVPKAVLVLSGAGALLVLLAVVALLWPLSSLTPTELGWFGYATHGGDDAPVFYVVTSRDLWGVVAATLGLATIAAAGGYVLGARRTAARAPTAD